MRPASTCQPIIADIGRLLPRTDVLLSVRGANTRTGSTVDWPGAVYARQRQLGLDVRPGGITVFDLCGYA
ncbi:hypothetical protein DJ030_08915 [bacterium endosymbiont of Escarpia laminata]|nr:MAG: hypothetical protein DJ031_17605 [bacterium endosymbiont of Escarpia laminata]RLJ19728.1 MAG: hypothetical protein DJ030_08915 [bacterium endosymbiont of Escarpia laminata]